MDFERALCDLGDCVSLVPLWVCEKLDMGEMRPIVISLQLADRKIKCLMSVLIDVPVRLGEFYILVDFVIMDIKIPIILGRDF